MTFNLEMEGSEGTIRDDSKWWPMLNKVNKFLVNTKVGAQSLHQVQLFVTL